MVLSDTSFDGTTALALHLFDASLPLGQPRTVTNADPAVIDALVGDYTMAGMKVAVTGTYAVNFTQSSTGAEADPVMGLMSLQEMKVLEPVDELATLPTVKRKEKRK